MIGGSEVARVGGAKAVEARGKCCLGGGRSCRDVRKRSPTEMNTNNWRGCWC